MPGGLTHELCESHALNHPYIVKIYASQTRTVLYCNTCWGRKVGPYVFPGYSKPRQLSASHICPRRQMLTWRIGRYTPDGVETRLRYCDRMLSLLDRALPRQQLRRQRDIVREQPLAVASNCRVQAGDVLPGIRAHRHTLWLFPVMVAGGSERADGVVEALLREGFDATRAPTSLVPIDR